MTINEYQVAALRTVNEATYKSKVMKSDDQMILNGVMGLAGESGECVDIMKKVYFQGHRLDSEHLAKELGDVAWYLAVTAHAIGYDLESVLQINIDKLKARYPDGFDPELSQHRKVGDI